MTTTDTAPEQTYCGVLTIEQRRRVEALHEARKVLIAKTPFSGGPADAEAVIKVARFITAGASR